MPKSAITSALLLAEEAGLALSHTRNVDELEGQKYLIAARLLTEADADLGDVEQWTVEGERRTKPPAPRSP